MPLQKQTLDISFAQGLDLKSDPFRVQPGRFLALENSIFTKAGLLQKRNGFGYLPALPDATSKGLAIYNDNLLAMSSTALFSYSADNMKWTTKSGLTPVKLDVQSIARPNVQQLSQDTAVASNGLVCTTWEDANNNSYYQVADSVSGEIVVSATALPSGSRTPKVVALGRYFVVVFFRDITGVFHLQSVAIPLNAPGSPIAAQNLNNQVKAMDGALDIIVANNTLYMAFHSASGGDSLQMTALNSTLLQLNTITIAVTPTLIGLNADNAGATPIIWATWYDSGAGSLKAACYDHLMQQILAPMVLVGAGLTLNNLTLSVNAGTAKVFYDNDNAYSFSATKSDFVSKITVTQGGSVGSPAVILRSVGLASKAVYYSSKALTYMLVAYGGSFQPTYFLIDEDGIIISKLAYSNGKGYNTVKILPQMQAISTTLYAGYLTKSQLTPVNKSQGVSAVAGVYAQLGINLASFLINDDVPNSVEIGNNLHIGGGFVWMYDGVKPVEHNFHVWPEDIGTTSSNGAGALTAQQYYYQVTYEWTDAKGNIHRSAPSIPVGVNLVGPDDTITLHIPTLRLTAKEAPNNVKIVIYRWSTAQQTYYQITSIAQPTLNDTTVDSIDYVDTQADSAILGNLILYTTGNVLENIAPPAANVFTLFKSRLFLVDAEDNNLIWYSKSVIEKTPAEMSDALTQYIAPTIGAQGNTGGVKVLAAMDDKLILFKKNAIYYMTGNGPDITGANNDFSEPIFIVGTVGCVNPNSIVLMPNGIMFQSDKGIWLLGRDLSTSYIGAAVENYNENSVLSALTVPGTNQVRFTMDNGVTLMYDYFYGQWGSFTGIDGVSSVLFQDLHTFLDSRGRVYQETPGLYIDGAKPVLMSFTTGWLNLAGLQGFQRAYEVQMLGTYMTPHKISVQVATDYNQSFNQALLIPPDNFNPTYGDDYIYGDETPYGGNSNLEKWRIFITQQKCTSLQFKISEVYDPSFGIANGLGMKLSGLNLVYGVKKAYRTSRAANSAG